MASGDIVKDVVAYINVDSFGRYKYVRFDDDRVLFGDGCSIDVSHKDLAMVRPENKPVSAGMIAIKRGYWSMDDKGSVTLGLNSEPDDSQVIDRALRRVGLRMKQ
jgi:hypothetical protein